MVDILDLLQTKFMAKEKTIFEMIIDGEIPAAKFYEDDICIGIVDKFPTTKGQALIIPKNPDSYLFNLDDKTYNHVFKVSKAVVRAIDIAFSPIRTCLVVEGFEVPHSHIKLFPVYEEKLQTSNGIEISDEEANEIADKIRSNLEKV